MKRVSDEDIKEILRDRFDWAEELDNQLLLDYIHRLTVELNAWREFMPPFGFDGNGIVIGE